MSENDYDPDMGDQKPPGVMEKRGTLLALHYYMQKTGQDSVAFLEMLQEIYTHETPSRMMSILLTLQEDGAITTEAPAKKRFWPLGKFFSRAGRQAAQKTGPSWIDDFDTLIVDTSPSPMSPLEQLAYSIEINGKTPRDVLVAHLTNFEPNLMEQRLFLTKAGRVQIGIEPRRQWRFTLKR